MNVLASQHHTHAGVRQKKCKIYNIPYITVVAECRSKMYQSGRLPSKQYRALPWGLSTTVACTRVVANYHPKMPFIAVGVNSTVASTRRVADYLPKNTVHYRGGWTGLFHTYSSTLPKCIGRVTNPMKNPSFTILPLVSISYL